MSTVNHAMYRCRVINPRLFSSQCAMEFEPIVTAYEAIWRPCLTSFVSDLAWEMETSRQLMDVSSYRSLKTEGYFVGATYCLEGNIVINSIQKYLEKAHGIHWFAQQELQKLSSNAGFTRWEHQTYR
jgi:hypothetical protein